MVESSESWVSAPDGSRWQIEQPAQLLTAASPEWRPDQPRRYYAVVMRPDGPSGMIYCVRAECDDTGPCPQQAEVPGLVLQRLHQAGNLPPQEMWGTWVSLETQPEQTEEAQWPVEE